MPMSPTRTLDELRQLVELGLSQPAADAGDPRVAVPDGELPAAARGVGHHRAELIDAKRPKPPPHPLLPKENRPARVELDRQGKGEKQRGKEDQSH